jgi:hypothetical protein
MFSSMKLIVGAALALVALLPAGASAFTIMGDPSPAGNSGSPCIDCSFFQIADTGGNPYMAATPGVITTYGVTEGTTFPGTNNVRAQIWRDAGGGAWTLVNESAPHDVGFGAGGVDAHGARLTIAPGDRIGLRVNYGGNTSIAEGAADGNTIAAIIGSPTVGSTVAAGSISTTGPSRANIYAFVEPDGDGDGFGDESQDLCVGDPAHGDTPCSGVLIGPMLTEPMETVSNCFAISCVLFPTGVPGGLATSPVNGVIVRWRMKANPGSTGYRLRVVQPLAAGDVRGGRSGPTLDNPGSSIALIRSEELHIPIAAGETIGLQVPNGGAVMQHARAGAGTSQNDTGLPDGTVGGTAIAWPSDGMFNADVEPDADGDGFGDVTQDVCPSDATAQGVCPASAGPANAVISALKTSPKRFRAKSGTTISFNLSLAADVKFVVSRSVAGRLKGKKCVRQTAKNRKAKLCRRFTQVKSFTRTAQSSGANSFKYSSALKVGTYRLIATPQGVTSAPTVSALVTFKVIRK